MYTTIEADILNGRITSPELRKFPVHAHVLITLLAAPIESLDVASVPLKKSSYDFSLLVGKLKWRGDAVKEQRKLRNEW